MLMATIGALWSSCTITVSPLSSTKRSYGISISFFGSVCAQPQATSASVRNNAANFVRIFNPSGPICFGFRLTTTSDCNVGLQRPIATMSGRQADSSELLDFKTRNSLHRPPCTPPTPESPNPRVILGGITPQGFNLLHVQSEYARSQFPCCRIHSGKRAY